MSNMFGSFSHVMILTTYSIICAYICLYCILYFRKKQQKNPHVWTVFGSGGHTAEMRALLNQLYTINSKELHLSSLRVFVANNDPLSYSKAKILKVPIHQIPRSRNVHQSWFTSVFTTFYSIIYCFLLVTWLILTSGPPNVILLNGPGVCIPVIFSLFFYRKLGLIKTRSIFVESLARVKRLSLSGKILKYIVDRFLVQWPELSDSNKEYHGRLAF